MENDKNKQGVIYIGCYPTLSIKKNRIEVLSMKKFLVQYKNGHTEYIDALSCEKYKDMYKFIENDTQTAYIPFKSVQGVYELVEIK